MNEIDVNTFNEQAEFYQWYGRRPLALNGTRLVMPNQPTVIEKFGQQSFVPKFECKRSLALASMLYDVLNQVTIDAQIAHLQVVKVIYWLNIWLKLKNGIWYYLTGGYPCFWLLFILKARKIDFCVRLQDNWRLKVKDFTESADKVRLVTFNLP